MRSVRSARCPHTYNREIYVGQPIPNVSEGGHSSSIFNFGQKLLNSRFAKRCDTSVDLVYLLATDVKANDAVAL